VLSRPSPARSPRMAHRGQGASYRGGRGLQAAHGHSCPRSGLVLLALAGLLIPLQTTLAVNPAATPPPAETELFPEVEGHLAILRDPAAERPARDAAAEALVRLAHRPPVAQALSAILLEDEHAEPRSILLRAIARSWNPSARLFRPLVELAERSEPQRIGSVFSAIAAFPTREGAATLIGFLAPDRPSSVRESAAAALTRMTGRDEFRTDHAGWTNWLAGARGLSDGEWRDLLAEGIWRRSERLEGDRRALGERVAEGFRRLYISTPVEERSRLLSQMMQDTRAELRDVGLEIASRELAAGKTLDASVTDAAIRLLRSSDPRVRSRAAVLISQLGAAAGGRSVVEALATETDPETAAALLLTVARAPDIAAAHSILRWIDVPETRTQAVEAALALHRTGLFTDADQQQAVLAVLQQKDPTRLSPGGVRLLAAIGNDGDRHRLTILLEIGSASAKQATAEALAEFHEFVDVLLHFARTDPGLFSATVRSVATWRATVNGLMAVSELAAPTPQEHRAGVLRVASTLPMVDLLAVAASTGSDLSLREALLVRAADRPMGPFLPDQEEDLAIVGECILLLAETRLALRRPDLAMIALDALPSAWPGSISARAVRIRLIALLWTNRIAATSQIDAPASAWLDALELAITENHAPAILREVRARTRDLTPEEQRRLDSLAAALPPPPVSGANGAGGNSRPPAGP
jgi:hypothetical protein